MALQKTVFGRSKRKANLILGGLASTYKTPAQVSTLLGQYAGATPIVWTVGKYTYLILNNFVTLNSIIGNTNLTYIIETTNMTVSGPIIKNCPNLIFVEYHKVTTMGAVYNCVNLNFSLCKFPLVNNLTSYVDNAGGAFGYSTGTGVLSIPSIATLGQQMNFAYCTCTVSLPVLVNASTYRSLGYFFGTLNAKKLTNLGTPSTNSAIFDGVDSRTVLNVNIALATCNSGTPDADIAYAVSRGATVNYFP